MRGGRTPPPPSSPSPIPISVSDARATPLNDACLPAYVMPPLHAIATAGACDVGELRGNGAVRARPALYAVERCAPNQKARSRNDPGLAQDSRACYCMPVGCCCKRHARSFKRNKKFGCPSLARQSCGAGSSPATPSPPPPPLPPMPMPPAPPSPTPCPPTRTPAPNRVYEVSTSWFVGPVADHRRPPSSSGRRPPTSPISSR